MPDYMDIDPDDEDLEMYLEFYQQGQEDLQSQKDCDGAVTLGCFAFLLVLVFLAYATGVITVVR